MCRTGFRGAGQSMPIKYGADAKYKTREAAAAAAAEWVTEQRKLQGYPP